MTYRLPELLNASEIYIVEGEKDADRLAASGIVATCNPGGALEHKGNGEYKGKWPHSFARWFVGRHVIILPDDQAGRDHAEDVAGKLQGAAASVKVLELPGLPEKGDVSDWIAAGGTIAELQNMAPAAPYWEPNASAGDETFDKPDGQGVQPFYSSARRGDRARKQVRHKDVVPYQALGEIYAPPGGGKTAVAVDMGLYVGAGRPYRGRRTERQPVAYIALEGHSGIGNRVAAARRHLGLDGADIPFALIKIRADFRIKERRRGSPRPSTPWSPSMAARTPWSTSTPSNQRSGLAATTAIPSMSQP